MKNHYLLTTVLLLPCITTTLAVKAINDTEKYPVCVSDSDCEQKNLIGHACFQYFCYPWQDKATEASDSKPLELCRRDSDCPKMLGGPAKCFRHYERRKVTHGVCVPSIDTCDKHDDCYAKVANVVTGTVVMKNTLKL